MAWLIDPPGGASNHNFPRRVVETEEEAKFIASGYPAHTQIVGGQLLDGGQGGGALASPSLSSLIDRLDLPKHTGPANAKHFDAATICTEAARLVGGDRAVTHGDKLLNFTNTVALWNAIIAARLWEWDQDISQAWRERPPLTALDVANMLEAFKIARRYSGSHNIDNYIDGAGYAACAGEIAESLAAKDR